MTMYKYYYTLLTMLATSVLHNGHGSTLRQTDIRNACEGSILRLECSKGQSINVTSARYGQWSESICSQHQYKESVCYKIITKTIVDICNGEETCEINVNSKELGDSCPQGTLKEAEIEFFCSGGEEKSQKTDHVTSRTLLRKKKSVKKTRTNPTTEIKRNSKWRKPGKKM